MITAHGISRSYGDFRAVDGVSFTIGQGEVVGLLGPNGAGKTTIMKMLTGCLEPDTGRIEIDGLDMLQHRRRLQRSIGYLPENCPVYPDMTVADYLDYRARLQGVANAHRDRAVRDAIRRTQLGARALAPIGTLSRGYRQRVGVAQAILHAPRFVILDEPTNGLDPSQIRQMRELVRDLAAHATVVISTHILQEVEAVCARVLMIRGGRLVLDEHLENLGGPDRLLLTVDVPPGRARRLLAGIAGVAGVEARDGGDRGVYRYRIRLERDTAPGAAPRVARALLDDGAALYALHPERRDLEAVFREVNEQPLEETAHA